MSTASTVLKVGRGLGRSLRGFGRGTVKSGALKPAIIGGGAIGVTYAAGTAIEKRGRQQNPRLQHVKLGESDVLFDPRTGSTLTFGAVPSDKGDPERSDERTRNTALWAGGAALLGLVVVLVVRGR